MVMGLLIGASTGGAAAFRSGQHEAAIVTQPEHQLMRRVRRNSSELNAVLSLVQVAKSLAETVLTPPGQQVKVLRVSPVSRRPCATAPSWQAHCSRSAWSTSDAAGLFPTLVVIPRPFALMQRRAEDRNYLEFEFAAKSNTYIRLAIAVVTVANGEPCLFEGCLVWLSSWP